MSIADDLTTYTIPGTDKVIKAGDCVLLTPPYPVGSLHVTKVLRIKQGTSPEKTRVHVQWYFTPEETLAGRKVFHGMKELFLSDCYGTKRADRIQDVCYVHSVKAYAKLEIVRDNDYFSCYGYIAAVGGFTPDQVEVFCKCELPWNPDKFMAQCDTCGEWYHPEWLGLTTEEEANQLQSGFTCPDCSTSDVTEE